MRPDLGISAAVVAASLGFAAGKARPAAALDEHAGHEMGAVSASGVHAPQAIAIHENTGINTWTRGVADQLAADDFIGIAPDLTTMFRTGDLKADPAADAGRAAIGQVSPEIGDRIIDAVAAYGMSLPAAQKKYGIVALCWCGGRSFSHATHARINATIPATDSTMKQLGKKAKLGR
jgi:dienelactone hydrolase